MIVKISTFVCYKHRTIARMVCKCPQCIVFPWRFSSKDRARCIALRATEMGHF